MGAQGRHKRALKSKESAQGPALGPQEGPGRLPGTIIGAFGTIWGWIFKYFGCVLRVFCVRLPDFKDFKDVLTSRLPDFKTSRLGLQMFPDLKTARLDSWISRRQDFKLPSKILRFHDFEK